MESLLEVLTHTLSPELLLRRQAENILQVRSEQPEFFVEIATVANRAGDDCIDQRKAGLVALKNVASVRWAKVSRDVKARMQPLLLPLITHRALHMLAASCVAVMAITDFPLAWPTLVQDLGDLIMQTRGTDVRANAIRGVGVVCEHLTQQQLKDFVPLVVAIGNSFLVQCAGSPEEARAALHTMRGLLTSIGLTHPDVGATVGASTPNAIRLAFNADVDLLTAAEAVGYLRDLTLLKGDVDVVSEDLLLSLMQCLERVLPSYLRAAETPSVGEEFHRLASGRLDLLQTILEQKRFRKVTAHVLGEQGPALCTLLLKYATLSSEAFDEWTSDPNAFLAHESAFRDRIAASVRDVALYCIQAAVLSLGVRLVPHVMAACNSVLEGPIDGDTWKQREAALTVIGHLLLTRGKALHAANAGNCAALCHLLVDVDLSCNCPMLAARALHVLRVVMSRANKVLDDAARAELVPMLLPPSVVTLGSADALVVVSTFWFLGALVRKADPALMTEHGNDFFLAVNHFLVAADFSGEALYLCLETATEWIRRSTPDCEMIAALPEGAIKCWMREMKDPNIGELMVEFFAVLRPVPACQRGICDATVWMSGLILGISGDLAAACAVPYTIQIIGGILANGHDATVAEVGMALLPPLCQLLLSTEDSAVVAAAAKCFAMALRRLGKAVEGTTVPLLPSLLAVPTQLPRLDEQLAPIPVAAIAVTAVELLLSPDRSDTTLLEIGVFLDNVLDSAPSFMSNDDLSRTVNAIARRVVGSRLDSVLQQLVAACSTLVVRNPGEFLSILGSERCEPFFTSWLSKQHVFVGRRTLLRTCTALSVLLDSARIGDIQVHLSRDEGKSRQRRIAVPLRVAIFTALGRTALAIDDGEIENSDDSDDGDGSLEESEENGDNQSDDENPMTGDAATEGSGDDAADAGNVDNDGDDDGWTDCSRSPLVALLRRSLSAAVGLAPSASAFFTPSRQRQLQNFLSGKSP